jgi:sugar phosphate isomerase/epimerase
MTRRTLVGTLALAAAAPAQRQKEWKPKLGVLGPFSDANVAFARQEGFTNMILGASPRSTLDASSITDEKIEHVKATLAKNQMHVSALQLAQNHISPDATQRGRENDYFVKAIEMAGKLGIPYVGTCSGKDTQKPFQSQVDEIVRVYN